VRIWKQDGDRIADLEAASDIALQAVFTHDGKHVVTGDWRGDMRVLAVEGGKKISSLDLNPPTIAERIAAVRPPFEQAQATYDKALASLRSSEEALNKATDDQRAAADEARAKAKEATAAAGKQLTGLRAELAKWKAAESFIALSAAEEQLEQTSARQQQVIAALEEMRKAIDALQQHPQRIAELEQALAAATAAREKLATELPAAQAVVGEREALAAKANDLLKLIESAAAKAPEDPPTAAALEMARAASTHLGQMLKDAQTRLVAVTEAATKAEADYSAAEKQLALLRSELESAPSQLETAQKQIAASVAAPVRELKDRIDTLTTQHQILSQSP
jgi:chromosome segregation ATPase